jgi:transposase, IS5 family
MGFCISGIDQKLESSKIVIYVKEDHPLVKLANTINWERLTELILPDLKNSTVKLKWWFGRKLCLRSHLGVYLLQQLLNATDRGIEQHIKFNAAYQMFCGKTIVKNWRCPDHTKIEEFRSRLSPATQCFLANEIAHIATKKRFAKPQHIDIDSTIQEPDMQYPSISNMLIKITGMGRRVQKLLMEKCDLSQLTGSMKHIDMKHIKSLARTYFFIKRKKSDANKEKKDIALKALWCAVSEAGNEALKYAHRLLEPIIFETLNSREQELITQFTSKVPTYLSETFEHNFESAVQKTKIFSMHRNEVDIFNKQKENKAHEVGRQFQIGRMEGNFVWSVPNHSIRMHDPESLKPMIRCHLNTFQQPIESAGADKGYYSKDNEQFLLDLKIPEVALQKINRKYNDPPDNPLSPERLEELVNRRSGIEGIIGHLKRRWQMGRSRMKSDRTTESSGYCAMLGFNLSQLMRNLNGEVVKKAA